VRAIRWAEGLEPLLRPIDTVKQHPENPNNGDVDAVIESIQVNGFNGVITVDSRTGTIVAGHTKWAALHALGSPVAPFIFQDWDNDEGVYRFLIGDNETGKLARMDQVLEARILKLLNETERGLIGTGVTQDKYMDKLIAAANLKVDVPQGGGFGASSVAPSGIFQVVVSFRDEDERDELFADLAERPELEKKVRSVNL
jgi:hypothetical protein